MNGGKARIRKGMKRARLRKPTLSQGKNARPRDPVFLTPAAQSTLPQRKYPVSAPPTRQISRPWTIDRSQTETELVVAKGISVELSFKWA